MTTQTQHTPGPWEAISLSSGTGYRTSIFAHGRITDKEFVAEAKGWNKENAEANAALIASAPSLKALNEELVEALGNTNDFLDSLLHSEHFDHEHTGAPEDCPRFRCIEIQGRLKNAAALILKAKGGK